MSKDVQRCKGGGAAYPRASEQTLAGYEGPQWGERGLTKREHVAALALQGILASLSPEMILAMGEQAEARGQTPTEFNATMAVQHADALLAELGKDRK